VALYIGLMSGTSLDGVDAVLTAISSGSVQARAHVHRPFEADLRGELLALNTAGSNELHRMALASNGVARAYAACVAEVLLSSGHHAQEIAAVGAHGQTVRHCPGQFDGTGYTAQLLNAPLLAELIGIDVVADFRSRDVAAGGQGAPLAPAFHAAVFSKPGVNRALLNLGGIANLTRLGADGKVQGFDTGPANALLDGWCERHQGHSFDADGDWAAGGQVIEPLLVQWLAEPYFGLAPPKSTGRDLFNMVWLERQLTAWPASKPRDVQATLARLTVQSVAHALQSHMPQTTELFVCGGGARNGHLVRSLAAALPSVRVDTTHALGVPVDQVEAVAFAWLAHRMLARQSASRNGRKRRACSRRAVPQMRKPPEGGFFHRSAVIKRRTTSRTRTWWSRWGS
jgi:anhydro-N-acetylmuramic acid kinase